MYRVRPLQSAVTLRSAVCHRRPAAGLRMLAAIFCAALCTATLVSAQAPTTVGLPAGMAYDSVGNLFIADAARHQIVEVTVGGAVSVVAGSGEQGFGGDGAPANTALLNEPQGIAVGADGTLFIADTGNRRVRAVTRGMITTVAGSGLRGDSGDGGPATNATFDRPTALSTNAGGGLLICDTGNNRVRLVTNGSIQSFAGSGTQGFAGDGSTATAAQLDAPQGVAVLSDGRVVIADSHNNRLRIVGVDGMMRTLAGTGAQGYSGDGGPGTAVTLALPRGVTATTDGSVVFADSNNQRIRVIDSSGNISTLAGNGTQGASDDAATARVALLDSPKGVAVSPYGAATTGDSSKPALKAVAADGRMYLVPAPASRTSTVSLSMPQPVVYGQTSAAVTVAAAAQPQGAVEIVESGTRVSAGMLSAGSSALSLATLSAGSHSLVAHYAGDGVNPAASSSPVSVAVQPVGVVASANAVNIVYGQVVPPMSGTVSGILPQDIPNVGVSFATQAALLSDVGIYPISASLTGSGSSNYFLSNGSSSGSVTIQKAQSRTAVQSPAQARYEGMPLPLTASVLPQFSGAPSGEVDFLDNGAVVAKGSASNGSAAATYLSPTAGTHSITATYVGNSNFTASNSSPLSVVVNQLPDFTIAANGASQSVQSGLIATFVLDVTSKSSPFTGSVVFSVSGLPPGSTASFAPTAVVPGSAGAATTLSIQTPAQHASVDAEPLVHGAPLLALLPFLLMIRRRGRSISSIIGCGILLALITGCGARTAGVAPVTIQSYPLVVTGTGTNLTGAVVSHNLSITLTTR